MPTIDMPAVSMIAFAIVQALVMLALAPLMAGISRMVKARMHSRRGPGVLQEYRDLAKLLKRQDVAPANAGIIFRLMPYVLLGSMLLIAMALPIFTLASPLGWRAT